MLPERMQIADTKEPLIWSDWLSQLKHRITTVEQLRHWINVTEREEQAIKAVTGKYRWSITPYYASLMDEYDEDCPIRLQAIPHPDEMKTFPNASVDPVGDTVYRKTNRVVHKYPDRVVVLVTSVCPVYCRHCTRKYHTADLEGTYFEEGEAASWEQDFEYIAQTPAIRDVLLTGGDPLTYSDDRLERIISRLRQIPHVEIIRIGSRLPVLLPQRITPELCGMLEKYHPVWLNTHFNHPKEIAPESAEACDRLLRHGIPVQNQSVLLKGINDDLETMRALVTGISHFVTSIEKGREIMRGLLGYITGFAVPQYVLTTPLGKIPLWEEVARRIEGGYRLKGYTGETIDVGENGL
jgi:lysine 2,3-aminomutase